MSFVVFCCYSTVVVRKLICSVVYLIYISLDIIYTRRSTTARLTCQRWWKNEYNASSIAVGTLFYLLSDTKWVSIKKMYHGILRIEYLRIGYTLSLLHTWKYINMYYYIYYYMNQYIYLLLGNIDLIFFRNDVYVLVFQKNIVTDMTMHALQLCKTCIVESCL